MNQHHHPAGINPVVGDILAINALQQMEERNPGTVGGVIRLWIWLHIIGIGGLALLIGLCSGGVHAAETVGVVVALAAFVGLVHLHRSGALARTNARLQEGIAAEKERDTAAQ